MSDTLAPFTTPGLISGSNPTPPLPAARCVPDRAQESGERSLGSPNRSRSILGSILSRAVTSARGALGTPESPSRARKGARRRLPLLGLPGRVRQAKVLADAGDERAWAPVDKDPVSGTCGGSAKTGRRGSCRPNCGVAPSTWSSSCALPRPLGGAQRAGPPRPV